MNQASLPWGHGLAHRFGVGLPELVDLVTPFAVVGCAALVLVTLRARPAAVAVAVAAAIAYVDGHGIHLAANSLAVQDLPPGPARTADFWDERFGHLEWHLGLLGLLAAFVVGDDRRSVRPAAAALSVALLAPALAAPTLEGQSWWLVLIAAPLFAVAASRLRSHVAVVCAAALLAAAVAILVWAAYWGGFRQPTEVLEVSGNPALSLAEWRVSPGRGRVYRQLGG